MRVLFGAVGHGLYAYVFCRFHIRRTIVIVCDINLVELVNLDGTLLVNVLGEVGVLRSRVRINNLRRVLRVAIRKNEQLLRMLQLLQSLLLELLLQLGHCFDVRLLRLELAERVNRVIH